MRLCQTGGCGQSRYRRRAAIERRRSWLPGDGGLGASGIGAYHGEASSLAFTHQKPVFVQPRLAASRLLYPPYGATFEKVLALLKRLAG
jgi:hypothetical protein